MVESGTSAERRLKLLIALPFLAIAGAAWLWFLAPEPDTTRDFFQDWSSTWFQNGTHPWSGSYMARAARTMAAPGCLMARFTARRVCFFISVFIMVGRSGGCMVWRGFTTTSSSAFSAST